MNSIIIEIIIGIISGLTLGITGIVPTGLILLALDFFQIDDYKTNIGTILFLNLFPITAGSVYEFYQAKKINFAIGYTLLFSIIVGSFIGSKFILNKENKISVKSIKYFTSLVGFIIGICFLISAYYEKV